MIEIRDFLPDLRQAIALTRRAGSPELARAARELEERSFKTSYTTSSEFLGEVGAGIEDFLKHWSDQVPEAVRDLLRGCQLEVAKVWPRYASEMGNHSAQADPFIKRSRVPPNQAGGDGPGHRPGRSPAATLAVESVSDR